MGLTAHAFDPGIRSEYAANRVLNSATHVDRSWSTPGGATVGKSFSMNAPGGRSVAARMTLALGTRGALTIGASALAVGSGAGLALGAAALLYDVYRPHRVFPDGAGGLSYDAGTGEVPFVLYGYSSSSNTQCLAPTPAAFSECVAAQQEAAFRSNNSNLPDGWSITETGSISCTPHPSSSYFVCERRAIHLVFNGRDRATQLLGVSEAYPRSSTACPPYVDPYDPAYSSPGGGAVGPDGKCPGGTVSPISPKEAAEIARQYHDSGQSAVDLKEVLDAAFYPGAAYPIPDAGVEWSVDDVAPNPLPGPVTTTVNSDGTTTQQATRWEFTRINEELYNRDFAVDEVSTTTVTDAEGNVVSETTTSTSGETPEDADPLCEVDPSRIGCLDIGEAPG